MRGLLDLQREAFTVEMNPPGTVRHERLRRLGTLLDAHADGFAAAIAADFGARSVREIELTETMQVRSALRHTARHLDRWMRPRRAPVAPAYRPARALIQRQPLGVVGIVSPWNYPLQLSLLPLIAALAAGNRAMIKPSESTPRFAEALRAAVEDGFAADEVAVVTGDAAVGRAFCALPFDHLLFTGSTPIGREVALAAAAGLTPVTLELGGKCPVIVDASADLAAAATSIAWGKLINAGQTCVAPDYALVPSTLLEPFVGRIAEAMRRLYPRFRGNPDYTAIIDDRHAGRLQGLLRDACEHGARAVEIEPVERQAAGAYPADRRLAPVLLPHVDERARVMREEIFGPLLPILPYDAPDEAIAFVNRRPRPLALYWFGRDRRARERVLAATLSGGVTVNDTLVHVAQHALPFGGVGESGHGQYHGEHGFLRFSLERPVFLQSRWSMIGLIRPPYRDSLGRWLAWLQRLV
ncbi:MAG: aldehyde dehydrogenase family protein [Gammaproteobacteria bacterium]|nr:aldehyde dehydrogenase family protein [Gammaproteobacteria bacterium]